MTAFAGQVLAIGGAQVAQAAGWALGIFGIAAGIVLLLWRVSRSLACRERLTCPWCDTHACIDRTMCNCRKACGSWLCEAGDKEASRG